MKQLALAALLSLALTPLVSLAAPTDDVKAAPSCPHCGMDRAKFASSRMVIQFDDGTSAGTCSLHCAAVDLAVTLDKAPVALQVADMTGTQLIDAEKAFWVMGGGKPGVMTKRAKWAFADKAAAEAFAKEQGAALVTFEEALRASYEDMYQDTKMIREKRKMMRQKMMMEKAAGHGGEKPAEPAKH
ncbi:MAG: nitrous oxide reductase accessory protein NosL [Anaeromyxobacter sp.]|nr:nitrous oxide reductase accessory protein NosL [Anaeromyxobacter sp.]MBL0275128.1 nitrous oxide reductase accessory protein NosL [Anaeromyxobacter sp.]